MQSIVIYKILFITRSSKWNHDQIADNRVKTRTMKIHKISSHWFHCCCLGTMYMRTSDGHEVKGAFCHNGTSLGRLSPQ